MAAFCRYNIYMAKITIRIPDEIHTALKESAERNLRSLNSEILKALTYYLKNSPEAQYFVAQNEEGEE